MYIYNMQTYWFLKWHVNYCEIKPAWSIWKLHALAWVLNWLCVLCHCSVSCLCAESRLCVEHSRNLHILGFDYLNRFAGNVVAGTGWRKFTCTLSFKVVVLLAGASACPVLTSFELATVCSPVSPRSHKLPGVMCRIAWCLLCFCLLWMPVIIIFLILFF